MGLLQPADPRLAAGPGWPAGGRGRVGRSSRRLAHRPARPAPPDRQVEGSPDGAAGPGSVDRPREPDRHRLGGARRHRGLRLRARRRHAVPGAGGPASDARQRGTHPLGHAPLLTGPRAGAGADALAGPHLVLALPGPLADPHPAGRAPAARPDPHAGLVAGAGRRLDRRRGRRSTTPSRSRSTAAPASSCRRAASWRRPASRSPRWCC